ncbi:MAG: IS3 family transposase [Lachnospiraceae bacterium]|nr:IS3 family transposase [Lachnospiraceae bacterium]
MWNGEIKVITGIRRCGKSVLLFDLFYDYLLSQGTIDEMRKDIFEYVEMFYNRKRMYSYLGYMSPVEYRLAHSA